MKLGIAMPVVDTVPGIAFSHHVGTIIEAKSLMDSLKGQLEFLVVDNTSPHDKSRYLLAEAAIKLGCDYLFFMDDDTVTPKGGLKHLWDVMQYNKAQAVSGHYLRRGYPYTSVWTRAYAPRPDQDDKNSEDIRPVDAENGVYQITYSGLGCCLLDLGWMIKNLPKPWFRMKQSENFTEITDDVVMFEGFRKAGGLVLGDADVRCLHVSSHLVITSETADALRSYHQCLQGSSALSTLEKRTRNDRLKKQEQKEDQENSLKVEDYSNGNSRSESRILQASEALADVSPQAGNERS